MLPVGDQVGARLTDPNAVTARRSPPSASIVQMSAGSPSGALRA